jgi:hypothetical protein
MCEQQVSNPLRSNLRNERDIFDGRYFSEIPTQVGPGCLQRKGQTGGAGYHQYIGEFFKSPFQGQLEGVVIQMSSWVLAVIRLALW